jgi:hypothetical protein
MSNNPLADFIGLIKEDLIHSLQSNKRVASGKTIETLEQVDQDHRSYLEANAYIDNLEFGRPPTSPDAEKGNPTVFDEIQEWVKFRGIPLGAAWAITQQIHKKGYPGTPDVLTMPLGEDNINNRLDQTMGELADITAANIAENLHIPEQAA